MTKYQKSLILKISLTALVVVLDLLTKIIFFGKNLTVLPGIIGVRPLSALNTGGAWGILSGSLPLLIAVTLLFLAGAVFAERHFRQTHPLYVFSFAFIVGGALGNLLDRIFLGGVRDFIFFEFWHTFPTFNLADSFLSIGMLILLIFTLFFYKPNEQNHPETSPKNAQNQSKSTQNQSKMTQKHLKNPPKSTQNQSKTAQKPLKNRSKTPRN